MYILCTKRIRITNTQSVMNLTGRGVKEGSILGQVKYLMRFCVRKLRAFLGFYLANSAKLYMKNDLKCRHLRFQEFLKINNFYTKK